MSDLRLVLSIILYTSPWCDLQENLKDEHRIQEDRPPGHRVDIDRDCRSRDGGHRGPGHVHQELCAMQEDVGRLLRGVAVR